MRLKMIDNLIKERYCINEEKNWDDICKRVATYIGNDDEEIKTFYKIMLNKDFIPNSPTLMNAGTSTPMLSACFKAGTMIETDTIPTPIEQIHIGDNVLSHDGTYNRVTNVMIRNGIIYKVKIDKLPPMYVTGEHPFLTNNGWKCVKDLIPKKDFIKIGCPSHTEEDHIITFKGKEIDGYVYRKITNTDSIRDKKRDYDIQVNPIKNNVIVDEDLSWLIGMYLSEGSLSKGYDIRFVLNLKEREYAYRISSILENKFGLKSTIKETLHPTQWLTVRVHSKFLAKWIDENFGHTFNHKHLPQWVYKLKSSYISSLIQGVDDGDGCNYNCKSRIIVMCNEPLVRQVFMLIKMVGYSPTLSIWKMPKLGTVLPCAIHYKRHNEGMVLNSDYYRVSSVELTIERNTVYNLEVNNTHTYVANQIIVHNCFFLPISDCISNGRDGIFDQVKNAAMVFKFGGGVGLNFSNLRPAGSMVKSTSGVSSGVVSFMKNFNTMTETIKQGGKRRGALMGCLDIDHPEIKDFITCKTNEGDLSNFNISVKLTDKFLERPDAEILNSIVDGIYKNGEPGILFSDTIEKYNHRPDLGELNPNPCLHKDTYMFTQNGLEKISTTKSKIYDGKQFTTCKTWSNGIKRTIKITTKSGYEYITTPDHMFMLEDENWCEAQNLLGKKIKFDLKERDWVGIDPYSITDYNLTGKEFEGETIPDWMMSLPKKQMKDFINGLFNDNKNKLTSINKNMLQRIQQMLLLFGIKSKLRLDTRFLLSLSINKTVNNPYEIVSSIEDWDESEVWDFESKYTHYSIINGAIAHNCSEALLTEFESCNLLSINWSNILSTTKSDKWVDNINWTKYEYLIRNGIIFLNRVIDKNKYPLPEIDTATKLTRKIGLGGMGLHDMLIKLKVPYESELAKEIEKEIELFLKKIALDESEKQNFNNTSLTTIAPTGTISIIADVSSGIEPVFNWVITRKDSLGEHYVVHPLFEQELELILPKVCDPDQYDIGERKRFVIEECHKKGTIQHISWLPTDFKELFKNAMDINWKTHVETQAIFQNNGVDMSISKTINLPNNATKDDIRKAIYMAWELGCKGLTIYRSGSREHEVLNLKKEPKIIGELKEELNTLIDEHIDQFKRPRQLFGATFKVQSGCGKLYVTINERNGKPYEVFIQSGGSGGCEAGNQALGRTISLALRNGGDIRNIIKQLAKVRCPAALKNIKSEGKSCSDIVGNLIRECIPDEDESDTIVTAPPSLLELCPGCHERTLVREAGCKTCHACGYSKCG